MKTTLLASVVLTAQATPIEKQLNFAEVRDIDDFVMPDPPLPPYQNYSSQEECEALNPEEPPEGWTGLGMPYWYTFVPEACICEIHTDYLVPCEFNDPPQRKNPFSFDPDCISLAQWNSVLNHNLGPTCKAQEQPGLDGCPPG